MLTNVDKDIFLKSPSINITPYVTAEWNQNIFNSPYATVAGNGVQKTCTISPSTPKTITAVTDSNKNPYFDTFKYNFKSFISRTFFIPFISKHFTIF